MHIAQIAILDGVDHRTSRRRTVNFAALARDAGTIVSVEVSDLSTDGCRMSGEHRFEQGVEIIVKLPQVGAYRARVAWSEGNEAGCEFEPPLDPRVVGELLLARESKIRAALRAKPFGGRAVC